MPKSAKPESYDCRTAAANNSFSDFLKRAEADFLQAVGKVVNAKQRYCTCRVREGHSLSYLIVEGTDTSDITLEGAVSIDMIQEYQAAVHLSFDSAYRGKLDRTHRDKVGVITVDMVAAMVLEMIGVPK